MDLQDFPEDENHVADELNVPNNISVDELDEETNKKLKGDTIGDTLYSQSFVLKTLLQFSNLKWDSEIEEDLCFLWDMTVEEDVCKFLFEMSYPTIACSAVMRYTENRFIEIAIGILANILCANCSKSISENEIRLILRELDTDDHFILIQVVRFITAVSHMSKELPFLTSEILCKINFILSNSMNEELLLKTLQSVGKLTVENKMENNIINIDIIKSSFIAYKMVCNDNFELDTQEKRLACKYMLEIVCNFCTYVNKSENNKLLLDFKECSGMVMDEIIKILNFFLNKENLLPVADDFIYFIAVFKFILEILDLGYVSDIFLLLVKILNEIIDIKESLMELIEIIADILCYLIDHASMELLYKDLKCLPRRRVKHVLDCLNDYKNRSRTLDI